MVTPLGATYAEVVVVAAEKERETERRRGGVVLSEASPPLRAFQYMARVFEVAGVGAARGQEEAPTFVEARGTTMGVWGERRY